MALVTRWGVIGEAARDRWPQSSRVVNSTSADSTGYRENLLMTEIRVLWRAVKSTYRERREQGEEPIQAGIAAFKAYQNLMKQKTNWLVVMAVLLIVGSLVFGFLD